MPYLCNVACVLAVHNGVGGPTLIVVAVSWEPFVEVGFSVVDV